MSAYVLAWVCCVGFGAGWVRGFAGFGFSALCMAGLAWLISPALIAPIVVLLEMVASVLLWRGSVAAADKNWLKTLLVVNAMTVPVGVVLLQLLPIQPLRVVVAVLLFAAAFGLRFVLRADLKNTAQLRRLCGVVSGLVNGVAASGGVIAAMSMAATGMRASQLRATMILYLLFTDMYILASMLFAHMWSRHQASAIVGNTLFNNHSVLLAAALGLPMAAGIVLGRHRFQRTPAGDYRGFVLNVLMLMSSISLLLVITR
ncbi:TSUP family transporter [Comamonadaceae bacterium M7527]|nr:TSUP family transporter [Comamonadaceae bacterium M7527]